MSEVIHLKTPKEGKVIVTSAPLVTEREIAEDRGNIIQTLHAAYLTLNDSMSEFQKRWDANPTMAFLDSARDGAMQGSSTWLSDQAELFDKATWTELGGKIENFAGGCLDRMAAYSKQQYKDLEREVNKHVANPGRTLYNWAWWQKTIEDQVKGTVVEQRMRLEALHTGVRQTAQAIAETADKARKVYRHRDAILNLPVLIAAGEPKPIQAFVDTVVMDIDPELGRAIRTDPNFAIVLEIIADNESALSYVSYVSLMIEAIPPNFYAFIAGKGAAYVAIELVMLVITALLSAGAAAAARVAALVVRLATTSAKVAGAAKHLRRAKEAVDAFIRALEDLMTAVNDLHALGAKLVKARSKGLTVRGNANTRLAAKKGSIRRDKKCLVCGRTDHPTPRHRRGVTAYL